jgi:hypothetical protein
MNRIGFGGILSGKDAASAEINRHFHPSTHINKGFDDGMYLGGDAIRKGRIDISRVRSSRSSAYSDDLATRVMTGLQEQGRANSLILAELARVSDSFVGEVNNANQHVKVTVTDLLQRSRKSQEDTLTSAKNSAQLRTAEVRNTLQTAIDASDQQIKIINRHTDHKGQLIAGIRAVTATLNPRTEQREVQALNDLAHKTDALVEHGNEQECVASRIERVSYLVGRTGAVNVLKTEQLAGTVDRIAKKLAMANVETNKAMFEAMHAHETTTSRLLLDGEATFGRDIKHIVDELININARMNNVDSHTHNTIARFQDRFDASLAEHEEKNTVQLERNESMRDDIFDAYDTLSVTQAELRDDIDGLTHRIADTESTQRKHGDRMDDIQRKHFQSFEQLQKSIQSNHEVHQQEILGLRNDVKAMMTFLDVVAAKLHVVPLNTEARS